MAHLPAIIEAQLLYIYREALTNIRRHSGAHEISIKIQSIKNQLRMSIIDNGRSVDDINNRIDSVWTDGHGLQVVRERCESVGGKLNVINLPHKGTEIKIEIPLDPYMQ